MLGVTSTVAAAAPRKIPVERVRVTVTGPGTGAAMTGTEAAGETWCVAQTTASSSAPITIPRMTAVRDNSAGLSASQTGDSNLLRKYLDF